MLFLVVRQNTKTCKTSRTGPLKSTIRILLQDWAVPQILPQLVVVSEVTTVWDSEVKRGVYVWKNTYHTSRGASPIRTQQLWPHAAGSSSPPHSAPTAAPGDETLKSKMSSGSTPLPPRPQIPSLWDPLPTESVEFSHPLNPRNSTQTRHPQPTASWWEWPRFTCWKPKDLFHNQNMKYRPNNEISSREISSGINRAGISHTSVSWSSICAQETSSTKFYWCSRVWAAYTVS